MLKKDYSHTLALYLHHTALQSYILIHKLARCCCKRTYLCCFCPYPALRQHGGCSHPHNLQFGSPTPLRWLSGGNPPPLRKCILLLLLLRCLLKSCGCGDCRHCCCCCCWCCWRRPVVVGGAGKRVGQSVGATARHSHEMLA